MTSTDVWGREVHSQRHSRLSGPLEIAVACNILSITNIDTPEQTFDCECVLRCTTLNARKLRTMRGEKVKPSNFEPRLRFLNLTQSNKWRMREKLLDSGELSYKYTIAGTFKTQMDLQRFPFDKQRMSLVLSSAIPAQVGDKKIIRISKDTSRPSVIARSNFSASNVFQLGAGLRFREDLTDIRESTSGTIRPRLEISFSISRYSEYWIWNVVLPLQMLLLISLGSFGLDVSDKKAERLTITVTMLLTIVAFKLQLASNIPKLQYLTLLDKLMLFSFFYIGAVSCENILAPHLFPNADGIFLGIFLTICEFA